MARRGILTMLGVAIAAGGCGGDSKSGSGPREVVEQYFAAFADGDAKRSCALLAPQARSDLANYVEAVSLPGAKGCESELRLVDRQLTDAARRLLRRARVTSLQVRADRATATVKGADRPLALIRRDGAWRIARLDFRYQTFRVRAGQVCTRYESRVASLARPAPTRAGLLGYLEGLRSALEVNRRGLGALGRPPERVRARDELLAGFAAQQRNVEIEISRLRGGASVRAAAADFERRQRTPARAVNAAQATLQIRCGERSG